MCACVRALRCASVALESTVLSNATGGSPADLYPGGNRALLLGIGLVIIFAALGLLGVWGPLITTALFFGARRIWAEIKRNLGLALMETCLNVLP